MTCVSGRNMRGLGTPEVRSARQDPATGEWVYRGRWYENRDDLYDAYLAEEDAKIERFEADREDFRSGAIE